MPVPPALRRAASLILIAYLVFAAILLFSPLSPDPLLDAVWGWLRDGLGWHVVRRGWVEFALNIVLFMPVGLLVTLLFRRVWFGIGVGLVVSVAAEAVQMFLPARFASLRDILANALGALIGGLIALLIEVILRRSAARAAAREDSTRSAVHDRR